MQGERAFIDRIRASLPGAPDGELWVGDDAAVVDDGRLLAADTLVAGVHFDLRWTDGADVGWKAMVVNLSDIAAMGGDPVAALVSLVVPPGPPGLADAVLGGVAAAGEAFECPVVGGDTTSGSELVVTVAVLGHSPTSGAVRRSGARPGDGVFVTGALGGARGALHRLRAGEEPDPASASRLHRPRPRLDEGRAAAAAGATAMIDLSDGLGSDLGHVCEESGVGVRVEADSLPLDEGVTLDDALAGGDDYELCFTAGDPALVAESFLRADLDAPSLVGTVTSDADRVVVAADGTTEPLPAGWEHPIP